eukprot:2473787-Rhodomonas_salina.1
MQRIHASQRADLQAGLDGVNRVQRNVDGGAGTSSGEQRDNERRFLGGGHGTTEGNATGETALVAGDSVDRGSLQIGEFSNAIPPCVCS